MYVSIIGMVLPPSAMARNSADAIVPGMKMLMSGEWVIKRNGVKA